MTLTQNDQIDTESYELDPVFLNSRREAIVIIMLFILFMGWSIGVSFVLGHESKYLPTDNVGNINVVFGMPSWIFYGVALPWMVANVVAIWFCFWFMQDDQLSYDRTSKKTVASNQSQ